MKYNIPILTDTLEMVSSDNKTNKILSNVWKNLRSEYQKVGQPYIKTYSGINFTILEPKAEMILVEDIAHSLSRICRYGGHCEGFYSVATHSIISSYLVPKEYALDALMHDATEGYIGDCVTPLKKQLEKFNEIEDNLYKVIAEKFNLSYPMAKEVKKADEQMIGYEWDFFIEKRPNPFLKEFYDKFFKISNIDDVKQSFIDRFYELSSC